MAFEPAHSILRFSIRSLLGGLFVVAIGLAGLVNANGFWVAVLMTFAIMSLLLSLVACIGRRGASRMFWTGFAIFGWGYLWAAEWPNKRETSSLDSVDAWSLSSSLYSTNLLTTQLMAIAHRKLVAHKPPIPATQLSSGNAPISIFTAPSPHPSLHHFVLVGHALWTFFIAYTGGMIGLCFYSSRRARMT